jgi:hypothetical protein
VFLIVALAACGQPPPPRADHPAPAAPASVWWEIEDVEAAGVFGGAALRLGAEPSYLVMPTIPAFELCHVTVVGSRVTVTGVGQDATAVVAGDRMDFDGGFAAHRASPTRSTELDGIIPAVTAKCDRARSCYRAAVVVLGIANHEASDFGPLFRSDACGNIITNLVGDIHEAGKVAPPECGH